MAVSSDLSVCGPGPFVRRPDEQRVPCPRQARLSLSHHGCHSQAV